jgi:tyrosine phenol-lyase
VMFARKEKGSGKEIPAQMELVRLAFPRRVYTQSHFDYAIEVIIETFKQRKKAKGYRIVWEPPFLRHFTAHFKPID